MKEGVSPSGYYPRRRRTHGSLPTIKAAVLAKTKAVRSWRQSGKFHKAEILGKPYLV